MGRSLPLFLVRAAGLVCAAMLLLGAAGAHAQTDPNDSYGLNPLPGVTNAPPNTSTNATQNLYGTQNGPSFQPAPTYTPPSSSEGFRAAPQDAAAVPTLNGPVYGPPPIRTAAADPYGYYRPVDNAPRFNPDYVLGPGDKIRLTVFGEDDLSREYAVDGSGFVRLPLIGQVHAAGLTAGQLESAVGGAYAHGYLKQPRVSVEVTTYRPFYIIGAVGRPGEYPYVNNMTALNAVALAGGFTDKAIQSTLYVRHEGQTTEQAVRADQLTRIMPGDVVRVKTSLFWDAMDLISPISGAAAIAAASLQ